MRALLIPSSKTLTPTTLNSDSYSHFGYLLSPLLHSYLLRYRVNEEVMLMEQTLLKYHARNPLCVCLPLVFS